MAKRRRKPYAKDDFPGWVWMMFGLAIGLSVALAIWLQRNELPARPAARLEPAPAVARETPPPAAEEDGDASTEAAAPAEANRFDFYDMLPNFEVVIPEQEPNVRTDNEARAVVQSGVYVLQAGSFSSHADADRRRAQLALQGIESTIQRVAIDDKTYHRVRIGPIENLDELNMIRSRLRTADIDVLRIRLSD